MKKNIVTVLVFCMIFLRIQAQGSWGIGTTSPHSSAMLHVSSTTKGIRLPSIPGNTLNLITGAPDGLLVYNTTNNLPAHFDGTTWRSILTSDFWKRPIAGRNVISNTSDSFGIMTNVPATRLDVNGNILARDGIITQGTLRSAGDFILTGTSNFGQNLLGLNNIVINNTAAILNLQSSSVNTGFVQLSGDDLRLGTYSANSAGNVIFRTGGTDRMTVYASGHVGIGTTADPSSVLRVDGDIFSTQLTGYTLNASSVYSTKVYNGTTGSDYNLIPLCYGKISFGDKISGTDNFSVSTALADHGYGYYTRVFCSGINNNSIVIASINTNNNVGAETITYKIAGDGEVDFYMAYNSIDFVLGYEADDFEAGDYFSFVIYKSKP